ncbi:uncharacterized protein LOC100568464 isoform X2 [Acyrthosiphon pisum]|uniref:TTF-type domain-containing protein n=1 Tax=Acyrthosiphon pisum TaxID=7029 RepID=A0A8R2NTL1_ACYPI|nr:uncharacterized protein LOC100568464 isoform X2 [Acyrthosiphon pisum]
MTGKKKLSGYQNRKRALLKDKKELIAIKKCRKIQDMFLEKTSTVEEVPVEIEKDIQEVDQNTFPKVTEAVHNGEVPVEIEKDIQELDQNTFPKVTEAVHNEVPVDIEKDIQELDQNTFPKVTEAVHNGKVPEEIAMDIQEIDQNTFPKVAEYNVIPGSDPALWSINNFTQDYFCIHGFSQNVSSMNFSKSKRPYIISQKGVKKTYYRYFNLRYLQVTLKNGEKLKRDFLMYSESKGVIFCGPCLLFGNKSVFATTGFSNWQKAEERILEHSNSSNHRSNIIKMKDRGNIHGRIDNNLVTQVETQRIYWVNVLKRVVAVVKRLSSRGLAFRGTTSKIGCNNNGNFLMALELLAEFDPFLSNHLETYGNPGKGNTSYISYNIYEQFINIMSKQVLNTIIQEVKASRYFSISVDSTPDISHIDQLSFCVRYVNNKGEPVERFLCFLDQIGHKADDMANAVFSVLKKYDLNY